MQIKERINVKTIEKMQIKEPKNVKTMEKCNEMQNLLIGIDRAKIFWFWVWISWAFFVQDWFGSELKSNFLIRLGYGSVRMRIGSGSAHMES